VLSACIHKLQEGSGFSEISVVNSPAPTFAQYIKISIYLIAQFIRFSSCQKILLGTSLEVMAVKRASLRNIEGLIT
jgi:hypothetical protein